MVGPFLYPLTVVRSAETVRKRISIGKAKIPLVEGTKRNMKMVFHTARFIISTQKGQNLKYIYFNTSHIIKLDKENQINSKILNKYKTRTKIKKIK